MSTIIKHHKRNLQVPSGSARDRSHSARNRPTPASASVSTSAAGPLLAPRMKGPRPKYFIVRKSGEVVPLVAVDELPLGVDLVGVKRNLDLLETGGMLNLGLQSEGEGGFYGLVGLEEDEDEGEDGDLGGSERVEEWSSETSTAVSSPILLPVRSSASQRSMPSTVQHKPTSSSTSPRTQPQTQSSGLSSSIYAPSSLANTNPQSRAHHSSSGVTQQQTQSQRQICRHWCTHNRRCKWGTNCHYIHEMPRTRFELGVIGLSDWPDWFKRENLGFFPGLVGDGEAGIDRLRGVGMEMRGSVRRNLGGGMEMKERERGGRLKGSGVNMGMGVLEGEKVLERLREMEKLLKRKGVGTSRGIGKERDDEGGKRVERKIRDEKRAKEMSREEREQERQGERDREEKLEIRRAEAKKERERMRSERLREKAVTGKIHRGDVEGARKWEDESADEDGFVSQGHDEKLDGRREGAVAEKEKEKEKEKLVDV